MKTYIKVALILGSICAVSALLLAFVNQVTEPVIKALGSQSEIAALSDVAAGMKIGAKEAVADSDLVKERYSLGNKEGWILKMETNGYGGPISLVASLLNDGSIIAAKVVSSSETPGLGKKSELPGYMDMFIGKGASSQIPTSKDMLSSEDSQAVSGASVTFTAISKALDSASAYVKSIGGR